MSQRIKIVMKRCDLKLYRGYANKKELVVFGHVVKKYPSGDRKYTRRGFRYAKTIIELFSMKTIPFLKITLHLGEKTFETTAEPTAISVSRCPLPMRCPAAGIPTGLRWTTR
jgi:hypothetical protein